MSPVSLVTRPLRSQRLDLRPLCAEDEAKYAALFTSPEIMADVGPALGRDEAASAFGKSLQMMSQPTPGAWLWLASTRSGAEDIGLFGLVMRAGRPEIGAMVIPEHQGRGLAYEALSHVRDFGFSQLDLAAQFGHQLPSNRRSIGLMLKLGFDQVQVGSAKIHWRLDRDAWVARLR